MRDLFAMWGSTRMVVLTAISAALYAASLVAFKFLSILPGVTEIRPGVAFVLLCSLLFGPAGAWGAAIGNTIGDLAGGLGPGTAVGFGANLLFGLVPYKVVRAFGVDDPSPRDIPSALALVLAALGGSAVCALGVGWGIQAVGLWPIAFKVLTPMVFITNAIVTIGLGAFLVHAVYRRCAAIGLRYQDIMDLPPPPRSAWQAALGVVMLLAIAAGIGGGYAHEVGWLAGGSLDQIVGASLLLLVAAAALVA